MTGGEFGVRGRETALDAKTGKIMWRAYTLPAPGEVGSEVLAGGTIARDRAAARRSGTRRRSIRRSAWHISRPATAGRTTTDRCAKATTCSAPRSWRSTPRPEHIAGTSRRCITTSGTMTRRAPWCCSTRSIDGQPRKALAEAGRTGWVYILDRTNGKPLIGIDEKPVPQEPRQKTAKTQPIPVGDPTVPQCAELLPGYDKAGCLFEPFWDTPVLVQPSGIGRHQLVADAVQSGHRPALRGLAPSEPASSLVTHRTGRTACATSAAPRRRRSARR